MTIAWYGKVPARGDFVGHGFEPALLRVWDAWFQRGLEHAAETLGAARFEQRVLAFPPWRWLAWPDGPAGAVWAGVLVASRDRVGRAFPLLLAQRLTGERLAQLGWAGVEAGLAQLAQAAAAAAEPDSGVGLDDIAGRLGAMFDSLDRPSATPAPPRAASRKRRSALQLLANSPGTASLWWTAPAERTAPVPLGDAWPPHPELLLDLLADPGLAS